MATYAQIVGSGTASDDVEPQQTDIETEARVETESKDESITVPTSAAEEDRALTEASKGDLNYWENLSKAMVKKNYFIDIDEPVMKNDEAYALAKEKYAPKDDVSEKGSAVTGTEEQFSDEEIMAKIEKNYLKFRKIIALREKRREMAMHAFMRHGFAPRDDSFATKQFILFGTIDIRKLTFIMHAMNVLHTHCDIVNKWKTVQKNKPDKEFTMEDKDAYYMKVYQSVVKVRPHFRFQWISYKDYENGVRVDSDETIQKKYDKADGRSTDRTNYVPKMPRRKQKKPQKKTAPSTAESKETKETTD